jgi:hypothetical protein
VTKDWYGKYMKNARNSTIRKQMIQLKTGKRSRQIHHQRSADGKQAYEKILSMICH